MKITIEINMDNAAFEDCNGTELARICRELADNFDTFPLEPTGTGNIRDINGNTVGEWDVTEQPKGGKD